MSELTWKIIRPLANQTPIKKLEDILGVTFPKDYVECVMKNNAGYPSLKVFKTSSGIEHIFNNLLTLDENKKVNIFTTFESLLAATGNKLLIPFAEDPFGNYICFDFSDSTVRIVFWEHETKKTDAISETFTEFLANLSPAK